MTKIRFPLKTRAVVDVTKPSYYADPTGKKDYTNILRRVMDDLMGEVLMCREVTIKRLKEDPDPNAITGLESKKINGKIEFALIENLPYQKLIYFPNGIYRISDTVCYSFPDAVNSKDNELNQCIHWIGQSRDNTILRLDDSSDRFGIHDFYKPVISFMRYKSSNVAMSNSFENFTIDVGSENPASVKRIDFMYCDIASGEALRQMHETGTFIIMGDTGTERRKFVLNRAIMV